MPATSYPNVQGIVSTFLTDIYRDAWLIFTERKLKGKFSAYDGIDRWLRFATEYLVQLDLSGI